ncbi:GNAT family N-acetyltransferase [Hymenobacter aranciens]|uniref:GNAT family N-acetyltransferase n=1 Tax=Hymenobacter aranciens TaxID=3063996 RepID=UPI00272C977F|nr:GNAT family N-acetyltransferase [Hymenobacter sp. ASUV-10]
MPAQRLNVADLAWATELLEAALADYPLWAYLRAVAPGLSVAWLLRGLLRFGLRYGAVYASPERTALALWLPGRVRATLGRLLRAGLLPGAAWRLGIAGYQRLQTWLMATGWLHQHSAPLPHQRLLVLAVHPAARGRGVGRRLLLATLAARQATRQPCYTATAEAAQLPFFQRLGFRVVGHCPVDAAAPTLMDWALVRYATT